MTHKQNKDGQRTQPRFCTLFIWGRTPSSPVTMAPWRASFDVSRRYRRLRWGETSVCINVISSRCVDNYRFNQLYFKIYLARGVDIHTLVQRIGEDVWTYLILIIVWTFNVYTWNLSVWTGGYHDVWNSSMKK